MRFTRWPALAPLVLAATLSACSEPTAPQEEFPVAYSESGCGWWTSGGYLNADSCPPPTNEQKNAIRGELDNQWGGMPWLADNRGYFQQQQTCESALYTARNFISTLQHYTTDLKLNFTPVGGAASPASMVDNNPGAAGYSSKGHVAYHEAFHLLGASEEQIPGWINWCTAPNAIPPEHVPPPL